MPPDAYTHGHHDSVLRSHRWRTARNSAAYLLGGLHGGLDLLDVGCGPGTLTAELAALVAPGRTVGIDASPDIIDAARREAVTRGVTVEYAVGDAYGLDMADRSFDVVHAHQLLQHLSDPVAALREFGRVCRPMGVVAVRDADYAAMCWYPADPLLDRWMELYQAAARANRGEPDAGRRLLAWAHAAGFSDVTPSGSVWCYSSPEDRAWWGDLWSDRITVSALARQLVDSGLSTPEELASIGAAWRAWAAHPDGWFLVPHGEVLCRSIA
jgi:ubiquinone/menaquinone biosynthesis C-methylase UbiE